MHRRRYLAAVASTGAVLTAGCSGRIDSTTLSNPSVFEDAPQRRSLHFTDSGDEIGSFGIDAFVGTDVIELQTELWHRPGTRVTDISLHVWMPPRDVPVQVALIGPVEGDSSPPPSVSLYSPRREQGTVITVDDLDDLSDETISVLDFLVKPRAESDPEIVADVTIDLSSTEWLGQGYTLDGRLSVPLSESTSS